MTIEFYLPVTACIIGLLAQLGTGIRTLAKAEATTARAKQQEDLATASALKAQQKEQEANETSATTAGSF